MRKQELLDVIEEVAKRLQHCKTSEQLGPPLLASPQRQDEFRKIYGILVIICCEAINHFLKRQAFGLRECFNFDIPSYSN